MEFGMPTLIENSTLQENASLCNELGLSFLELNMNLPEYQADILERGEIFRELSGKYGIYYTIHLDENLNPCDFNKRVSAAYYDTVKAVIKAAKYLKCPIINMHMNQGVYFTLPGRRVYLYERYFDKYMSGMIEFIRMCETEIGGQAIQICIENTGGYKTYEKEVIKEMLKSPVVGLTWDIGHSYEAGEIDEPFLLEHKTRLAHFHIHDGLGSKNHLALGTGEIDLAERLGIAGENNAGCVIETKTIEALRKSVLWLKDNKMM